MDPRTVWISKGFALPEPPTSSETSEELSLIQRQGVVKVSASDDHGTSITWAFFSPNWASLYFAMETLHLYPPPYHLHYFLSGWFSETVEEAHAARDRMHALLAKSDVHLTSRTYVREAQPDPKKMPSVLQHAWDEGAVKPDVSVDCVLDPEEDRYKVLRIGPNSQIARLWGVMPVSYPCLNGGSYDQIVSAVYASVVETGEPHYGHVYAAMAFPNRSVRWLPYQRVVLPHKFPDGRMGVTVVSEASPVDIQIL